MLWTSVCAAHLPGLFSPKMSTWHPQNGNSCTDISELISSIISPRKVIKQVKFGISTLLGISRNVCLVLGVKASDKKGQNPASTDINALKSDRNLHFLGETSYKLR